MSATLRFVDIMATPKGVILHFTVGGQNPRFQVRVTRDLSSIRIIVDAVVKGMDGGDDQEVFMFAVETDDSHVTLERKATVIAGMVGELYDQTSILAIMSMVQAMRG